MNKVRQLNQKIPDIKVYRRLHYLLWKLHRTQAQATWPADPWYVGLKEAKDLMEKTYVYVGPES